MDILITILLLFLNFYTYLYISCKLSNYKFTLKFKNSFIILIFSIIYAILTKNILSPNIKILLTFLCLVLILKIILKTHFSFIIQICFFTIIIIILSEQFVTILFTNILNINILNIKSNSIFLIISNILVFSISIFIVNINIIIIKSFKDSYNLNINNYTISNIFIMILSFIVLFGYSEIYKHYNQYFNSKIFLIVIILSILSLCISLTFLYSNYLSTQNLRMLRIKEKEYNQLKLYSKSIENLIDDIAKFKHDYNNIIFMMNGYLINNEFDKLKNFFHKKIFNEEKYYDIYKLKKITNSGVKGLLAVKISSIIKHDISINIEIFNEITNIYIDELDLCRILGIFIDNAFEACLNSEDKFISISFIEDNGLNIIILNSYNNDLNINSIYNKGYSSKGSNRGLGLYNVKSIINSKYPNIILNTYIKDNLFIQDLYINKCS